MLYFPIKRIVKIGYTCTSASTQFLHYGKHWNWGWGWKISYKWNINIHNDLNLTLNDQIYNRNYNARMEETRSWSAWRCLATENGG